MSWHWVELFVGLIGGWFSHVLMVRYDEGRKRRLDQSAWDRICGQMPDIVRDLRQILMQAEFALERRVAITPQPTGAIAGLPGKPRIGLNEMEYPNLRGKLCILEQAEMVRFIEHGMYAVVELQEQFVKRLREGKSF